MTFLRHRRPIAALALLVALISGCASLPVVGPMLRGVSTFDAVADGERASMRSGPYRFEIDSRGIVWVLNRNSNKLTRLRPSGERLDVVTTGQVHTELAIDRDDAVWVAEVDGSLAKLDRDGKPQVSKQLGKGGQADLAVDSENRVWAVHFEGKSLTLLSSDAEVIRTMNLPENPGRIAIDGENAVWVSTRRDAGKENLFKFSASGDQVAAYTLEYQVYALTGAPGGGIWLSDSEGTLRRLDVAGKELVKKDLGGTIWGLYTTRDGDLWLTQAAAEPEQVIRLSHDGAQRDAIPGRAEDISSDPQGRVWFLNRLRGTISRFSP